MHEDKQEVAQLLRYVYCSSKGKVKNIGLKMSISDGLHESQINGRNLIEESRVHRILLFYWAEYFVSKPYYMIERIQYQV